MLNENIYGDLWFDQALFRAQEKREDKHGL